MAAFARIGKWLGLAGALSLLAVLCLLGWLAWANSSGDLLRRVVAQAQAASGGRLSIESPEGSPLGAMRARRIVWKDGSTEVIVDDPSFTVIPRSLLQKRLQLDTLRVRRIEVINEPSPEPASPPDALRLPIGIEAVAAQLDELVIRTRGQTDAVTLRDLRADLRHGGGRWASDSFSLRFNAATLSGTFAMGDSPPYALSGQLLAETTLLEQPVAINAQVGGTLSAMALDVRTVLHDATLSGQVKLAPFARETLAGVDLTLSGLNLARIDAGWPNTRLSGTISASAFADKTTTSEALDASKVELPPLRGTLALTNAAVGTLDVRRLPLQSLRGGFQSVGDKLDFSGLELSGPAGRLSGTVGLQLGNVRCRPAFDILMETP
jgi:translocation and assembly module TamB